MNYPQINQPQKEYQKQVLSQQELHNLEGKQEIFAIIRVLDVIEKCHNMDKIDDQEYLKQVSKLLQRYESIKKMENNFNLDQFVSEYQLDCKWALERIHQGLQQGQQNQVPLIVEIQNQFHRIDDALQLSQAYPAQEYKFLIQNLLFSLRKLQKLDEISKQEIEQQYEGMNQILTQKEISSYLDENEKNQFESYLNNQKLVFNKIINY